MGGSPTKGPDSERRAAAPEALRSAAKAMWIKYTEIRRLRRLHQKPHEPDPKRALMDLARRYPGSLRELDALPMETLDERIARLEHLIANVANVANADGSSEALPWVVPMARFHGLLQGALAVKGSLFPGGRRGALLDEGPLRHRLNDVPEALPFLQDLARLAAPPGGRLLPLVLEKLVAETGLDEPSLRELLHPLVSLPRRPPSPPTDS